VTATTPAVAAGTIEDRWLRLQPIKVGWHGMEWRRFEREIRMAFDEATERGVLDRRYEFLFEDDAGLPQGTAKGGIDAYHRLVDAGCLVVVGANYTDAAMALADTVNARQVPLLSMCGTDAFHGEYCFRLGNGDVGGDPALMVSWLKRNAYRTVAVLAPWTQISEEYFRYFRQECRRLDVSIAAVETTNALVSESELVARFDRLRAANADALAWLGYGGMVVNFAVRRALETLGWDPPRIMTTAFMQYIWGFEQLEGWVGVDQWCPDNPRMYRFHDRFVARYGEEPWMWPNAIPGLAYDMAVTVVEALHRATILTGPGVKQGFERIRFLSAVTGGPNTHIAGGPHDHQLFKGDWLHYGRVRNGRLEYAGLHQPADDD
jgi:ABC-type branched-subunit amino acid transport system substrate-binding protein